MAVTGTTRRERVRASDGTRPVLPGGLDSTGLSAIATCAQATAGVDSPSALTDAGRAAAYTDPVTPHTDASILVQSTADGDEWVVGFPLAVSDPAWSQTMRPWDSSAGRTTSPPFGAFVLDRDRLDDPAGTLAVTVGNPDELDDADSLAVTNAPAIYRPTAPLSRLIANPEAAATGAAWATGVGWDENLIPNPSALAAGTLGWFAGGGATFTRQATGGAVGAQHLRVVSVNPGNYLGLSSQDVGPVAPGEPVAGSVRVRGSVGLQLEVRIVSVLETFNADGSSSSTPVYGPPAVMHTVASASTWATLTIPPQTFAGTGRRRVFLDVQTAAPVAAGLTLDVDAAKLRRASTAGTYGDGTTATWSWAGTAGLSPSTSLVAGGTYSRTADGTAPALGLPGANVHRRTGTLPVGACLVSPWGDAEYLLTPGRVFTVAGWVKVTVASPASAPPLLRWVLEVQRGEADVSTSTPVALHRLYSAPFIATSAQWFRAAWPVAVPDDWFADDIGRLGWFEESSGALSRWRVRLEVVTAPTVDDATSTMSVRGAHAYAGPDRGDSAGLQAVPVVRCPLFQLTTPGPGFPVSRVDVHGVDRLSHVTAARVVASGGLAKRWGGVGASAGRLTVRPLRMPAAERPVTAITVRPEEVSAGAGGPVAVQTVVGWREIDASEDVVSLQVQRSTDADPTDSTVPVGNYAAATVSLELDDAAGDYSLFGRSYLDLGHRIEVAQGLAYVNRHGDPTGADLAAAGGATAHYPGPVSAVPAPSVVAVEADRHGQTPPAMFGPRGRQVLAAAHMPPGSSVRGSAWIRWDTATPTVFVVAGTLSADGSFVEVGTPSGGLTVGEPGMWRKVRSGVVTLPAGANAVALVVTVPLPATSDDVHLAAPQLERVADDPAAPGAWVPVEVIETAPAGIFYSTSWGDSATERTVSVQGVDVLGLRAALPLAEPVRIGTTAEADIRWIARRYFDLGSDQLAVDPAPTALPYSTPADDAGTQLADLAKVAALTVYTDGLGRLRGLSESGSYDPDASASYTSRTALVDASTTLTPDVVRNDVRVVTHPVQVGPMESLGGVGLPSAPAFPFPWNPDDPRWIVVPPNTEVTVEVQHDPAINPAWSYGWVSAVTGVTAWPAGHSVAGMFVNDATIVQATEVTATRFRITFYWSGPVGHPPVYVLRVWGEGRKVTPLDVALRYERTASVASFGRRPVDVNVRLAQSQAAAPSIAAAVLEAYSLRDEDGRRWLPDLTASVLYDPWREVSDAVIMQAPERQLGGLYRVVSHRQAVAVGGQSEMYVRRALTTAARFVLDVSQLDGPDRLTY